MQRLVPGSVHGKVWTQVLRFAHGVFALVGVPKEAVAGPQANDMAADVMGI